MKARFFHVGTKNPPWLSQALSELDRKLSRFVQVERHLIKSPKLSRDDRDLKIELEAEAVTKALKGQRPVVLLDEKGTAHKDSRDLSAKLVKLLDSGTASVSFLVGGAYGVHPLVGDLVHARWSLSGLTMNHHVAQLVLSEQIYRALCISGNVPYHND
jgi:23S rRNA (pseudouridine1915-N3)-methyltransferase